MSQEGARLNSDDGVSVFFVQDHCRSPGAARDELLSKLQGAKRMGSQWQIIQTVAVDNVLLVELADPVFVVADGPVLSKWVRVWVEDNLLNMIYGPDREHVDEYFRIRQQDQKHTQARVARNPLTGRSAVAELTQLPGVCHNHAPGAQIIELLNRATE